MSGGRPPVPTAIKIMRGNPGRRPMPKREPKPQLIVGAKPPSWVRGRARRAWSQISVLLIDMRVLTVADVPALSLLCNVLAEYIEASEAVRKFGMTYESSTQNGTIIRPRPEVAIAADSWRRAMAAMVQFGLTPSSRAKVATAGEGDEDVDPLELILGGKT